MSDTTFVNYSAPAVDASWLNDLNVLAYRALGVGGVVPTTAAGVVANLGLPAAADVPSLTNLANTTNMLEGVALIGGASRVVTSITALRALPKTGLPNAFVTGYYAAGDGGGGPYYYDAADTTSTDNGGTIIVAVDGGRWKLQYTGHLSVKQFGAKGDGVTDDTAAFNSAFAASPNVFGYGTFLITGTVNIPANSAFVGEYNGLESPWKATALTHTTFTQTTFLMRGSAQFLMGDNSRFSGGAFWYDQQNYNITAGAGPDGLSSWVSYNPTFSYVGNYSSVIIENVFMVGGTVLFYSPETSNIEKALFRNIRGFPLVTGFQIGFASDICRFENIHFNPNSMFQLPGYTATTNTALKFTANIVMFLLGRVDGCFIDNCFAYAIRDFVYCYWDAYVGGTLQSGGSVRISNSAGDVISSFLRISYTTQSFGIAAVNCWATPLVYTVVNPASNTLVTLPPAFVRFADVGAGLALNNAHVELSSCKTYGTAVSGINGTASCQQPIRYETSSGTLCTVSMSACGFDQVSTFVDALPDPSQLVYGIVANNNCHVTARGCFARSGNASVPVTTMDFQIGSQGTSYTYGVDQRWVWVGAPGTATTPGMAWTGRGTSDPNPVQFFVMANDGTNQDIINAQRTISGAQQQLLRVDKATGDVVLGHGAYDYNRLRFGGYYLWIDANGRLRSKSSAPSSASDGNEVGSAAPTTVAGLPSASSVGAGATGFVTDATVTTFGTAVVGGGTNAVPVYSNGTSWYIG